MANLGTKNAMFISQSTTSESAEESGLDLAVLSEAKSDDTVPPSMEGADSVQPSISKVTNKDAPKEKDKWDLINERAKEWTLIFTKDGGHVPVLLSSLRPKERARAEKYNWFLHLYLEHLYEGGERIKIPEE